MKRRTFIRITGATMVTVILPLSSCNFDSSIEKTIANPTSLFYANNSNTIRELGNLYLQLTPNEANKDVLKNLILKNQEISKLSNKSSLLKFLSKQIKNDFKINNTIIIDGWIISKTEARQCALYALINN